EQSEPIAALLAPKRLTALRETRSGPTKSPHVLKRFDIRGAELDQLVSMQSQLADVQHVVDIIGATFGRLDQQSSRLMASPGLELTPQQVADGKTAGEY